MFTLDELKATHNELVEKASAVEIEYKADASVEKLAEFNAALDAADEAKASITNEESRLEAEKAAFDRLNKMEAVKPSQTQEPKRFDVVVGERVIDNDPKAGFETLGEFAMSTFRANANIGGSVDNRLTLLNEKAAASGLNAGVGAEGGYTVPESFSNSMVGTMLGQADSLLGRANSFTVEGESLTLPGIDESSRATGSRNGGTRGYWLAEAAQITSSKPKFRQIKVEPAELAVLTYVTDKLLRQSPMAMEQFINGAAIDEINWMVGNAIINGSGAGQPLGIITGAGKVTQAAVSGQGAGTIVAANIDNMLTRLPANMRAGAVWFCNQDILPTLEGLETANGAPLFRGQGGLTAAPLATLKGLPVLPLEYCPTLGTEGDLILAHMPSYIAGVQGGISSAMSMHLRFDYNEQAFKWCFAVDGQSMYSKALTPANGTTTQAPFVTLNSTRS
jgi:HK97 family phage major capsid protein